VPFLLMERPATSRHPEAMAIILRTAEPLRQWGIEVEICRSTFWVVSGQIAPRLREGRVVLVAASHHAGRRPGHEHRPAVGA
jgi:hypothetical protein